MRPEARRSLPPGTRFGRYEVLADIAAGGMAMVYLGRALGAAGFQRLVAIKVMHAQYAHDEDFVAMFLDEARLAAQIRHPNVVGTLDLENDADGLYLVMEFIEGDTLIGLLKAITRAGGRLPRPVVFRIVLDALAGLHAAHELTDGSGHLVQLVHRDVSPHNVMVGLDGVSRITDFGIARAEERLSTTRNGQVKGKLAYMAPEQTSSDTVDRRADLFATGVMLWECIAGKRLFAGQSDGEVFRKLVELPIPRLSEVGAEVPPALDEVCARALARDRNERYATAAEFAEALENAAAQAGGVASARAVSQLVREYAGAKIAAINERARESRISSPTNTEITGPNSAVRLVRGSGGLDGPRASQPTPPALPIASPSTPPVNIEAVLGPTVHTGVDARGGIVPVAPSEPKRRGWMLLTAALVVLGIGVGTVIARRSSSSSNRATEAASNVSPGIRTSDREPVVPLGPSGSAVAPDSPHAIVPSAPSVNASATSDASVAETRPASGENLLPNDREASGHHRVRAGTNGTSSSASTPATASGASTAASDHGVARPATDPSAAQPATPAPTSPAPHAPYNPEAL